MIRWTPFIWASILAAATAGFGYGAALFAAPSIGVPLGAWWTATAQAHGHLQLFGWGGLMVLGVGFYFLPRLRGAPLAFPSLVPWVLTTLAAGLAVRGVAQPALTAAPDSPILRSALAASGLLELVGASLALLVLVATARLGPPLRQRQGLAQLLPFLATAFGTLWLALAINAFATLSAALVGSGTISPRTDRLIAHLGLAGFLVPVSVAISVRTFPLFLWLRSAPSAPLRIAFWVFLAGLILRSGGIATGQAAVVGAGQLLEGVAFVAFAAILQVVPLRRRAGLLPSSDPHYLRPVERLLVPAYLWLAGAGLLAILGSLAAAGMAPAISPDAEQHALGSGFITLLILGMAARMLPGFAGRRLASVPLVRATTWLGNASALLRVAPLLLVGLGGGSLWPFGPPSAAMAVAGLLGLAAVLCLGANLRRSL